MKSLKTVYRWLESIRKHAEKAPEGARVVPEADGKYSRYKLENVSPKAIKAFMAEHNLVVGTEWGRFVAFHESPYITVLDFEYPFLKKPEECETLLDRMKNTPKHMKQDRYRLIYRKTSG